MRVLVAFVVVLALFASCSFADEESQKSRKRVASPYVFGAGHWIRVHEDKAVTEDHVIYLNILLKQQNLDKLDQLFWEVNDPSSINYGLFATKEQINALVAPPASVFEAILTWLGKDHLQVTQGADYIRVVTTIAEARRLFKTEFAFFHHPSTRTVSIGNLVEATIPSEIAEHVDFITGLGPQIDRKHMRLIPQRSRLDDGPSGVLVTPFIIQKYYNVQPTPASGTYNQAIAAFDDFFSLGALQEFDAFYNLTTNNLTVWGTDCLQQQCDQFESDLDVQYITSLGYGVPTIFHNTQPGWILEWAQDINNETNPPNIYSISYGWTEDEQCAVDPHFCKQNNFTSWTYVNRSEVELQKLATRGVTVLIAAGDDGAPEYGGGGGNCPMDTSVYCTGTGCSYNSTQCGDLLLTNPRGVACQFPGGISGDGCNHIMRENRFNPALRQFLNANAACGATVEQDLEGNYWLYSNCSCSSLTLGNFHNLTFAEYTYNSTNGAPFTPDYPTSSAYVLSIGATQFSGDANSVTGEIVCSVETGALITGGGGFSNQISTPAWQQAIVSSWISSYGDSVPSGYFNPSGRGYPDLTLVGHNFDVYFSRNNSDPDSCLCSHTPVDGTSASTPSTAGLLSEVNQLLAASNLSPLGFANILLYTLDGSNFNDITVGNNRCNRAYCCLYGYNAVTGWDPASGLGSLNWTNFAKAVVDAKQAAADRRAALRN